MGYSRPMWRKSYTTGVSLYQNINGNPKRVTGLTVAFNIVPSTNEKGDSFLSVVEEENLANAYFSVSIFYGDETTPFVSISDYIHKYEHIEYDITKMVGNLERAEEDWRIQIEAYELDSNEIDIIYAGSLTQTLPTARRVYGFGSSHIQISNPNPSPSDTITISWSDRNCSSDPVNFPIAGYLVYLSYENQDGYARYILGDTLDLNNGYDIHGLLINEPQISIDLSQLEFDTTPLSFSIRPYLYWSQDTSYYPETMIISWPTTLTIDVKLLNKSSIVIYVKDSAGDFLLGETMFIKDSAGNWHEAESIQQNN